jgi:cell division protein FtsB
VNKVIIEKNKFETLGNTVLAPDEAFRKRNYEDLEKSREQIKHSKRLKNMRKKKNTLISISLGFVVGLTIVARYSMIYNYQNATFKAKAEIEVLNKENEAYKVQLIKFKNISYIEEIATEKLHMVKPRISDIEYCNLSKNNLETKEVSEVKISNTIISKIKNIIF